ncbi:alpha/beta fold hydrolase [Dyella nitratireducens]|uniref:Cysteine proteinase n=1 Tax=Dyella nitratireducens TaxID=1849580 RepID=A0ABQ1FR90_9GAMM|nr:alpha/beta fold hydrolase [Dyella nitratireducens]GGA26400.1 cysteine proteinase [Dyella nitratireducens]GLQ43553.1 cysteine proteinase [Dyella nitratireducens]
MALKARTVSRLIVVAVALGVLAYQHWHRPEKPAAATADVAPAAALVETKEPSQPARIWRRGSLTFTSCELGRPGSGARAQAWCTMFDVPENRDDPHGRHISLKLAIARSDAQVPEPDLVTLLAGGPGEAATEAWVLEAPAFADVRKHHDVLLLDQRGTGGSNPLSCKNAEKASDQNALTFDLDKVRKDVTACLDEVKQKADPRYYTTTIATQDLEDVRKALGSPLLDLVGVSYGTRMAQQYLKHYPGSVRSVVLDSVVPNQAVLGEDFAANLDDALKKDFAHCAAVPACKQRFGDSMQTLYQLRDALRANPHKVSFRDPETYETVERPLSEFSLASVVRMFAYQPETAALLPLSINAAAHGDVGPLLGQAKILSGDLSGDMNNGMSMSVICSEDADLLQPRPQDQNAILGNHLVDALKAQCDVWPHGARPDDFHAPLKSDKPILMLSGELDPVTPPRYGEQILPGLTNGRQLIFKGQGHSLLGRGCMPQLLGKFIDKPDPKQLDANCLDKLDETPAFIDFNGASP